MSIKRRPVATIMALMLGIACAAVVAQAQQALREGDGHWVRQTVSGSSPACTQMWACNPIEPVGITDQETLTFSASQTTDGRCRKHETADGACRVCQAPEPAVPCKWQVFERSP